MQNTLSGKKGPSKNSNVISLGKVTRLGGGGFLFQKEPLKGGKWY